MRERLVTRIYNLMLTDPEKRWTYDELATLLASRKKIICARCLELRDAGKIVRVLVPSGRPRGRKALVWIKPPEPAYPSWLATSIRK